MSDQKPKPYEELTEEEKLAHHAGENASLEFLKRHILDFVPNEHNVHLLTEAMHREMARTKTTWTLDNLQASYQEIRSQLTTDEPPAPVPIIKASNEPPFGTLTLKRVVEMPREEYRKWYGDKKWGARFREDVDALQIQVGRKRRSA
jgi:hypothetical protein